MVVPNNYEINVATQSERNARYGRYYCRIELGECSKEKAIEKFQFIKEVFPDDWNLTLYEITCNGKEITI